MPWPPPPPPRGGQGRAWRPHRAAIGTSRPSARRAAAQAAAVCAAATVCAHLAGARRSAGLEPRTPVGRAPGGLQRERTEHARRERRPACPPPGAARRARSSPRRSESRSRSGPRSIGGRAREIAPRRGERGGQAAVPLPQDHRILDAVGGVGRRTNFRSTCRSGGPYRQIRSRGSPTCSPVNAASSGPARQRSHPSRSTASYVRLDGDHEVEVAELVHRPRQIRTARGHADQPRVRAQALADLAQQGPRGRGGTSGGHFSVQAELAQDLRGGPSQAVRSVPEVPQILHADPAGPEAGGGEVAEGVEERGPMAEADALLPGSRWASSSSSWPGEGDRVEKRPLPSASGAPRSRGRSGLGVGVDPGQARRAWPSAAARAGRSPPSGRS